jgi:hypothetical protein
MALLPSRTTNYSLVAIAAAVDHVLTEEQLAALARYETVEFGEPALSGHSRGPWVHKAQPRRLQDRGDGCYAWLVAMSVRLWYQSGSWIDQPDNL